ncbi:MAG: hypothetical protein IID44_30075 [Planctomycetes bacterium]|nr:hypothetical protein [Planctomycetota bacterium]
MKLPIDVNAGQHRQIITIQPEQICKRRLVPVARPKQELLGVGVLLAVHRHKL